MSFDEKTVTSTVWLMAVPIAKIWSTAMDTYNGSAIVLLYSVVVQITAK